MANEEQEINQQPQTTTPATGSLNVHNPEDTTTPVVDTPAPESEDTQIPAQPADTTESAVADNQEDSQNAEPETAPTAVTAVEDEPVPVAPEAMIEASADEPMPVETTNSAEAAMDSAAVSSGTVDPANAIAAMTVGDGEAAEAMEEMAAPVEEPLADIPAVAEEVADEPGTEAGPDAELETAETALNTEASATEPTDNPVAELTAQPTDEAMPEADVAQTPEAAVDTDETAAAYANVPEADTEMEEETATQAPVDYSQFSKADFVNLLETQLTAISVASVSPALFKKADQTLKEVKPLFDQMKRAEREAALQTFTTENESDEGFEYKYDDVVTRFDELYKQIKSQKNTYFQNLDKAKDTNFTSKTELLTRLRELVETDESNAGDPKISWNEFKKIQDDWKAAGNMNSPHNATLWATYHALVDRYYSNRNIYFELKELDRKRNISLKTEVIEKVEAMAKASEETPVTRQTIDEANALFEEYKHIGPAPKAEQEVLWGRMKAALDVLYDKRRGQTNDQRKESAQLYEQKSAIYEELIPITSFSSNSINDWNDKTRIVMGLQDSWNAIKGPMPREEGKELSKKFWGALKTFFANKGEFFRQLESKREENLKAKEQLCEQVETILAAGEESPEITQTVIELQRQWKNVGQVPEKQKNTIFDRFKTACDAFFDKKRARNQDTEREFEGNLTQKIALIERIEAAATANADLSQLNEFKKEWNAIGFVPKKDKEPTQKRYINAINALVSATGKIPAKDKEQIMLDSEAETFRSGGNRGGGSRPDRDRRSGGGGRPDRDRRGGGGNFREDRDSGGGRDRDYGRNDTVSKRESDIRRRMTAIENDIATYRNNIEFFARSKGADKLRAEIDEKIAHSEKQLDELRDQLRAEQG